MRKSRFFVLLAVLCIIIAGFIFWQSSKETEMGGANVSDIAVIDQAYSLIKENSVYGTKESALIEGAIRGMAGALQDPYSTYYTEKEAALHKQSLAGQRVGIGIEITEKDGKFIVVSPVKSSPAEKAGIRPFDEIVQVDEERLDGKTLGELMQMIQGEAGEKISLVLYRPSTERHIKISVERAEMNNKTVASKVMKAEETDIGYVSISMFGEKTAEEWVEATKKLISEDVEGIIVDLRDNPGGYLHSVAAVVSSIEKENDVFAYMQNGKGAMEPLKTSKLEVDEYYLEKMKKLPVVVLQNEGSASASEVMAGAVQSWERALLVGSTSFGKGTVQETWGLDNGGELKLSTNKWLTPERQWIHGKGIEADIEVEQHPLFSLEVLPLSGEFAEGDFKEEVAYTQKVLSGLGYNVARTDGFYDENTAEAVMLYREQNDLKKGRHMDDDFFASISEQVIKYKQNVENDAQLNMGLSVMMNRLKGDI
ncbi:S41 family peptidase [Ureibacillus chungkukjangi]|uniref:Carboxyl-terminal processing protease n=1 Tax=Ureibacillus chungkukjangi TaxID=1202712 RepID=A0A318TS37_9BACL|nr:S41 family peptidase [Ureibacillus chungkukjangi]PYF07662.1 carboxyl-terminal processing protease [Ureibacillus chungkukjangi]